MVPEVHPNHWSNGPRVGARGVVIADEFPIVPQNCGSTPRGARTFGRSDAFRILLNTSVETTTREDVAHFSECGQFRYLLTREFGGESTCLFIMLNPSTADSEQDDPTIRRCISFAEREGFGRLEVVNLYGFRATKPTVLFAAEDLVGAGNDREITAALDRADSVIVAWGNQAEPGRVAAVAQLMEQSGKSANCFGFTKHGQPKHPLYLPGDAELIDYSTILEELISPSS